MRICNDCEEPLTDPEITQLTSGGVYEVARKCENCETYYSDHYYVDEPRKVVNIRDMIYTLRAADLTYKDEAMHLIEGALDVLVKTQSALADVGDILDVYEVDFVL